MAYVVAWYLDEILYKSMVTVVAVATADDTFIVDNTWLHIVDPSNYIQASFGSAVHPDVHTRPNTRANGIMCTTPKKIFAAYTIKIL